ncbi:MAG TPA: DNA polymerase III subunit delta [Candidatus Saccharimonadales bacterium]|nr:DNA polymerase III subunit delta [Candidatus Saccharimonadales bacterium]
MVVTLTGANTFALQAELSKLTADFIAAHTDMAVERYDGDEDDAPRMRESMASLPFLTDRKLVVLRSPGKQKAFADALEAALADAADSSDIVIVEPKLDKRLTYYKTLKKKTDFKEFPELDANGLARWASAYAAEQGGSLPAADARLLIERIGANQQLLQQDLNKLLAYDPAITRTTIELLTDPLPQSTVFELLDAAFSGNTKRALELYQEQRALKVEPQAIIAMLAWQLHILALIKTAGSRSADDIAKQGKVNPYVVRKSQGLARGLSLEALKQQVRDLLKLDLQLKTVSIDADEALRLFLIRLSR